MSWEGCSSSVQAALARPPSPGNRGGHRPTADSSRHALLACGVGTDACGGVGERDCGPGSPVDRPQARSDLSLPTTTSPSTSGPHCRASRDERRRNDRRGTILGRLPGPVVRCTLPRSDGSCTSAGACQAVFSNASSRSHADGGAHGSPTTGTDVRGLPWDLGAGAVLRRSAGARGQRRSGGPAGRAPPRESDDPPRDAAG
jgi:hypothetical protein